MDSDIIIEDEDAIVIVLSDEDDEGTEDGRTFPAGDPLPDRMPSARAHDPLVTPEPAPPTRRSRPAKQQGFRRPRGIVSSSSGEGAGPPPSLPRATLPPSSSYDLEAEDRRRAEASTKRAEQAAAAATARGAGRARVLAAVDGLARGAPTAGWEGVVGAVRAVYGPYARPVEVVRRLEAEGKLRLWIGRRTRGGGGRDAAAEDLADAAAAPLFEAEDSFDRGWAMGGGDDVGPVYMEEEEDYVECSA